jgi:hypothetical protein
MIAERKMTTMILDQQMSKKKNMRALSRSKVFLVLLVVIASSINDLNAQDTMGFTFNFKYLEDFTEVKISYVNKHSGNIRKSSDYYSGLIRKSKKVLSACEDTIIDFAFYPCQEERNYIYIDDAKRIPRTITMKSRQKQVIKFRYRFEKPGNYYFTDLIFDQTDPSKSFQICIKLNGDKHPIYIRKILSP